MARAKSKVAASTPRGLAALVTPSTKAEKYERLDRFIESLWGDVYEEPPSAMHDRFTAEAWERAKELFALPKGSKILDIGCGQGVALKYFLRDEMEPIGIAIGTDVEVCRANGHPAIEMDLTFLDFPDGTFDLVWCRHVLEHSVAPYFSLAEVRRVLRPGGWAYIEVPAPDTACRHQDNPNHYSVLTRSMWLSLMGRAGFKRVQMAERKFEVPAGPDLYWSFFVFTD
jgi:SAM-dependent methyltransferase